MMEFQALPVDGPPADPAATGTVPLRVLRAVHLVVACGSAARAAEQLHQSPAAVTRALQAAERQLSVRLFDRMARGMLPTPPGRVLAWRAGRALQSLQDGAAALRGFGAPDSVASLPRRVADAQLRALVARAQHPSEAAAAQALGITQPALNQSLRGLEHAARVPLFARAARGGARPTDAGLALLRHIRLALDELRIGHEEVARWRGDGASRVTIGVLPMAGEVIVAQTVAQVLAEPSAPRIDVREGTYDALTRALREAEIDFLVGPLRAGDAAPDLVEEPLFADRLVAVVRAGHPVLRSGRPAPLRTLAQYPWIGPLPGTPAHSVHDRLIAGLGASAPAMLLRTHHTAVLRATLLASDAVALLSPWHVHDDLRHGVLVRASEPLADTERAIGITCRAGAAASTAALAVQSRLREFVCTARRDGRR